MLGRKVALVTGAAQGIGLATTRLLLKHGAKVSMVDVNERVGREACSNLQKEFTQDDVMFVTTDVTNKDQLRSAFEQTKERYGYIDIVCNNAGILDEFKWRKTIDINLVAMIEGTYIAMDYMSTSKGGKGGTIINVSSIAGIIPIPYAPVYGASKAGIVGFTRSLRNLAENESVRVNCICLGPTDTPLVGSMSAITSEGFEEMLELERRNGMLQPEEVAEGMLELITDTSRAGAVMTLTLNRGRAYVHLPGDPKSKL